MKTVLMAALQIILASGILYGYYHFFLRNKKFHQYNRFFLLSAVMISIIVPFINIPVYFSDSQKSESIVLQTLDIFSASATDEAVVFANGTNSGSGFDPTILLYCFYGLIAVIALVRIIVSLVRIKKLRKKHTAEKLGDIYFVNTREPGTPFSFFRWMFWNQDIPLDTDKGQQIFRHELFHIRQQHSLDIIFIELIAVIGWFNPFYHLIKKEMRTIHEFLADQYAANENECWDYAELLLMQALHTKHSLVNPFFHNQIKRRIAMITSSQNPKHKYLRKILVLPLVAFVAMLFAFSYKSLNDTVLVTSEKNITVVIDAGHGGDDPGVVSKDRNYSEAGLSLALAKKIRALAPEYNINVVLTRENEKFPGNAGNQTDGLKERVRISEVNSAAAFISLHLNASENNSFNTGFDAYIAKANDKKSVLLASAILNNIAPLYKTNTTAKNRNSSHIYVLDKNPTPAVVLECGYLTNPHDLAFITNTDNQEKIARSILTALSQFSNSSAAQLSLITQPFADTPKNKSPIGFEIRTNNVRVEDPGYNKENNTIEPGLVIVNGKQYSIADAKKKFHNTTLKAETLITTPANNAGAIKKFGAIAKNGVLEFTGAEIIPNQSAPTYADSVVVHTNSGENKKIILRGYPSMNTDSVFSGVSINRPLYVVDGVRLPLDQPNALQSLNPDEIQSVHVIKDPKNLKYGDDGRNGVIEITTKKAAAEKLIVLNGQELPAEKVVSRVSGVSIVGNADHAVPAKTTVVQSASATGVKADGTRSKVTGVKISAEGKE